MPAFLLNYTKELFSKSTASRQDQVSELQSKLFSLEQQTAALRDQIESEQGNHIEQQRRKAELESELRVKDIQIDRLQRKAVQDLEILEENCKSLEERLREKSDDWKVLRDVSRHYVGKE